VLADIYSSTLIIFTSYDMYKQLLLFLLCLSISINCLPQSQDNKKAKPIKKSEIAYAKPQILRDGIITGSLKDVQINKGIIMAMEDSIKSGGYTNIHSVLIFRHNKLAYENYFPGNDIIRGKGSTGFVAHHRDSLHDIRSVNKSVVSAALMIAIGQGKIKSLNQRAMDFFPEYAQYDTGMKRDITIQNLLNMSAGLEWNEEISYTDTSNSERRMNSSADAIDFILSRNMTDVPGKKFNYNGGCTQLLAAIIEKVAGIEIDRFTELYLFKPLGIQKYTWVKISDGKPSAASGLRLRSRDMLKFGIVYLNNGKWNNNQIIPSHLVEQTLRSQISTPYHDSTYHIEYSNQFWIQNEISDDGKKLNWVQCQGNGGQIIIIDKLFDLVVVITAGNYDQVNLRRSSWDISWEFIYPSLISK
jgi:CubicO group peptidase (beta-lactamase class C family)